MGGSDCQGHHSPEVYLAKLLYLLKDSHLCIGGLPTMTMHMTEDLIALYILVSAVDWELRNLASDPTANNFISPCLCFHSCTHSLISLNSEVLAAEFVCNPVT